MKLKKLVKKTLAFYIYWNKTNLSEVLISINSTGVIFP